MNGTRILIAKYTPDIRRMEPRNFGVVVWSGGDVRVRFLAEVQGDDSVHIPRSLHVKSKNAYRQWVEYWKDALAEDYIRADSGEKIPKSSPEYLDILRSKSKDNYKLVQAATMLDDVAEEDLDDLLENMYQELVVPQKTKREQNSLSQKSRSLKRKTGEVFATSGVRQLQGYHENWKIVASKNGQFQSFKYDYAIGNGSPKTVESVFQRTVLEDQKSVANAMVTLKWLRNLSSGHLPKEKAISIIESPTEEHDADQVAFSRSLLEEDSNVLDVSDPYIIEQIKDVANVNGSN